MPYGAVEISLTLGLLAVLQPEENKALIRITLNRDGSRRRSVGLSDTIFIVTTNILMANQHSSEVYEVCDQLQKMGYAQSKRIRIYGQEFEAVSDPFPNGAGIAIRSFSKRETTARILQLPLPVVQMVTRQKRKKVA